MRFDAVNGRGDVVLVARMNNEMDETTVNAPAPAFMALAMVLRRNRNGRVMLDGTTVDGGPEKSGRRKK
jgi:hypothetical protein